MLYLIGETAAFLTLSALLWGIVGWWLGKASQSTYIDNLEHEHSAKLQSLRRARDGYRDQLEQVNVGDEHAGAQLSAQQRAQITAHVRKLEKEANEGRAQVETLSAKLSAVANNADARENEYNVLRERLENTARALSERDEHIKKLTKALNARKDEDDERAASGSAGAQQRAEFLQLAKRYEQTITKLKARVEALSQQNMKPLATTEHSKLLNVIQAQKNTIASLNQRIARSAQEAGAPPADDALLQRLQQQEAAIAAREKELARVVNERAAQVAAVERHEATIATLTERLRAAQAQAQAQAQAEPVDHQLRQKLAHQQQLNGALEDELARIREEHEVVATAAHSQKDSIDGLNARLRQAIAAADAAEGDSRDLRASIRDQEQIIAKLQAGLKTLAKERNRTVARHTHDEPIERSGDLFEHRPAVIMSTPDGAPDDLKQIHGVGPVLEAKLNELGIFHFRQIAAFDDEDIVWVAGQMNSFPKRILRDRWVSQAAQLEAQRRQAGA